MRLGSLRHETRGVVSSVRLHKRKLSRKKLSRKEKPGKTTPLSGVSVARKAVQSLTHSLATLARHATLRRGKTTKLTTKSPIRERLKRPTKSSAMSPPTAPPRTEARSTARRGRRGDDLHGGHTDHHGGRSRFCGSRKRAFYNRPQGRGYPEVWSQT
jgi:hypothetical protein